MSETTALTRSSTSATSYLTRSSTSGTSYGTTTGKDWMVIRETNYNNTRKISYITKFGQVFNFTKTSVTTNTAYGNLEVYFSDYKTSTVTLITSQSTVSNQSTQSNSRTSTTIPGNYVTATKLPLIYVTKAGYTNMQQPYPATYTGHAVVNNSQSWDGSFTYTSNIATTTVNMYLSMIDSRISYTNSNTVYTSQRYTITQVSTISLTYSTVPTKSTTSTSYISQINGTRYGISSKSYNGTQSTTRSYHVTFGQLTSTSASRTLLSSWDNNLAYFLNIFTSSFLTTGNQRTITYSGSIDTLSAKGSMYSSYHYDSTTARILVTSLYTLITASSSSILASSALTCSSTSGTSYLTRSSTSGYSGKSSSSKEISSWL